eukprot:TRINITY_DN3514_c0_g1_i1.p1 TRINITY_DN3514_c0_g1~~TRINITY_DN3514_c0_g1_i1.p1  ORF type:complete len:201 (+),score=44.93 TRINITY_DN3514_c0_g1_i1:122-724(+)
MADSKDSEIALQAMCVEYGKYLSLPEINTTSVQVVEDTIESVLVRLDEFHAFVEAVKADSTKTASSILPQMSTKCRQLSTLFPVIDSLKELVSALQVQADQIDSKINNAEKYLDRAYGGSSFGGISDWFGSFTKKSEEVKLDGSSEGETKPKTPDVEVITIVNTKEYFEKIRSAHPQFTYTFQHPPLASTATTTTSPSEG